MTRVLAISGSASADSSNAQFLVALSQLKRNEVQWEVFDQLREFPLFRPEDLEQELPEIIHVFKSKLVNADAILICTPEYTHNIPAVLKNALEWVTASGELTQKKLVAITLTPHEPRGEWAMQSLLFSLKTLNAHIVTQLPLYKTDLEFNNKQCHLNKDTENLLTEVIKMLV